MSFSTPHIGYIIGAYGITLSGLALFFSWSFRQWRKSQRQINDVSRETKTQTSSLP